MSEGNPSRLQVFGEAKNQLIWPYSGDGTPLDTLPFRSPEWGRAFAPSSMDHPGNMMFPAWPTIAFCVLEIHPP